MCNLKIHFSPSFQPIWHCTAGVDVIDGVVQAIGIQVDAADRFGVKAAHKIFVQEAARLGIGGPKEAHRFPDHSTDSPTRRNFTHQ